jgi:hypothetical protein
VFAEIIGAGRDGFGEFVSETVDDVLAAALAVESGVQARLEAAGGGGARLPRHIARWLWDAQWQAHRAVVAKTGKRKHAKQIQFEAAQGRWPLTVCVGHRFRRFPEHVLRFNAPDFLEDQPQGRVPLVLLGYGDGCGLINFDSRQARQPNRYCERCAARAGKKPNAGLYKAALARLRAGRRHT